MIPTTTPEGFQAPLIHLNGTGGETLVREYENARSAGIHAVRACRLVTINPRDYYPINPDAYDKAREEFCQQMAKLDEVIAYLESIMICVQDQQQERESRRFAATTTGGSVRSTPNPAQSPLLEALQDLIEWANRMGGWDADVWEKARAAVANAKGEPCP